MHTSFEYRYNFLVYTGPFLVCFRVTVRLDCVYECRALLSLCWLLLSEFRDLVLRGGGLGSRPKKMYGERLGDGVEYHLMKPTPRR